MSIKTNSEAKEALVKFECSIIDCFAYRNEALIASFIDLSQLGLPKEWALHRIYRVLRVQELKQIVDKLNELNKNN